MVSMLDHTTGARRAYSRRNTCKALVEALEERTLFSLLGIGAQLGLPQTTVTGPDGSLTYTASTHSFDATGTPIAMLLSTGPNVIAQVTGAKDMELHISVDNSGNLLGSGNQASDFVLTGSVDVNNDGTPDYTATLLTGTVQAFGYQDAGGGVTDFDFDFKVTGGSMATAYFTNKDIGVVITAENSTFASFSTNFSALTKGVVGPVPQTGNPPPISISGHKYQDMTGNGLTTDDLSHPIAGVTIQLYKDANNDNMPQNSELVATTTTDASGAYSFTGLSAGTYFVQEVIPSGYVETAPTTFYTVAASSGPYTGFNFDNYKCNCGCSCGCTCGNTCGNTCGYNTGCGNNGCNNGCGTPSCGPGQTLQQATSTLAGSVFVDCNNNGNRDYNESGISGVTITLTGTNLLGQNVTLTTTTNSQGNYQFSNLIAGTYSITETDPNGYADGQEHVGTLGGTAGDDVISNILVPPCANGTCYTFGELKTTCITGCTGHGGCKVTLTGCNSQGRKVTCTTTTDCHGNYNFQDICGGNYTISECNTKNISTGYCQNTNIGWSSQSCSFSFGGFFNCNNNNTPWFFC